MGKYFGMNIHARNNLQRRVYEYLEPECDYCHNLVISMDVPDYDDDEMWEMLAEEHDPECMWIATKGRIEEGLTT